MASGQYQDASGTRYYQDGDGNWSYLASDNQWYRCLAPTHAVESDRQVHNGSENGYRGQQYNQDEASYVASTPYYCSNDTMAYAAEQSRHRELGQVSVKESKKNMGKILNDITGPLEGSSKKDKSRSSKSNKSKGDKNKG